VAYNPYVITMMKRGGVFWQEQISLVLVKFTRARCRSRVHRVFFAYCISGLENGEWILTEGRAKHAKVFLGSPSVALLTSSLTPT